MLACCKQFEAKLNQNRNEISQRKKKCYRKLECEQDKHFDIKSKFNKDS